MKTLKRTSVLVMTIITLMSCGGSTGNQPANADGFAEIEKDIKSEFGENAYYTDLKIIYIESIGNAISLTATDAPESLKMGEWNQSQGTWTQSSEVSLEIPAGTKASDFMFQLNDKISLTKLGELVEKSMKQLTAEKDIENPVLSLAFVKFPKNGDIAKTEYAISLKPENGGTTFSFYYTLAGELINMDY